MKNKRLFLQLYICITLILGVVCVHADPISPKNGGSGLTHTVQNEWKQQESISVIARNYALILAGVLGFMFAFWRVRAAEKAAMAAKKQSEISEQSHRNARFVAAIDQLGSVTPDGLPNIEVRLGGIHTLGIIANESPQDYWSIMEVLSAYIRRNSPRVDYKAEESEREGEGEERIASINLHQENNYRADIQAIIRVIGRRNTSFENAYCWVSSFGASESKFLSKIILDRTDLRDLDMEHMNFSNIDFRWADLRGSSLAHSKLQSNFFRARLEGVNMVDSDLHGAALWEAHMEGAELRAARMDGAVLRGTHLEGADLKAAPATGLTNEQIKEAIVDSSTRLPDYLTEQGRSKN